MASFVKVCPSCKTENEVTMDFCVTCGNHIKLVIPTKKKEEIVEAKVEKVNVSSNTLVKYYKQCRVCGNKCYLENKEQFIDVCNYCGNEDINDIPTYEEVIKPEIKEPVVETNVESKKILYGLRDSSGLIINIATTSIIGRYGEVKPEYFSKNPYISGNHARIGCQKDKWFIEDLNSTNGTKINGKKCTAGIKYLIKPGFKITLANLDLEWVLYEN